MAREIVTVRLNKSARFLLPLIAHKNVYKPMYDSTLINTYIELPNILIIKSNCHNPDWANTPTLIEVLSTPDDEIIYKCKIPDKYQAEFDNFISGRYSEFSKEAKEIICVRNNGGRKGVENTREFKILYKSPDLKESLEKRLGVRLGTEAELFSIPNIEEELYERERIAVQSGEA